MSAVESVRWSEDGRAVDIIDQRLLPGRLERRDLRTVDDVCDAIATLAVRGAPAIGIAGAMGLVVALATVRDGSTRSACFERARELGARIAACAHRRQPLVGRAIVCWTLRNRRPVTARRSSPRCATRRRASSTRIARCAGASASTALSLLADGARILTHCNAGALATAGSERRSPPIYVAAERGRASTSSPTRRARCCRAAGSPRGSSSAPESRHRARRQHGRVAHARGRIDLCIVGADRIAANGDVANKVGTLLRSRSLARYHGVPFYVAAPIEHRRSRHAERRRDHHRASRPRRGARGSASPTAPERVGVYNPAFDVTPAELVTAIITDRGIVRPPYRFEHARHAAVVQG